MDRSYLLLIAGGSLVTFAAVFALSGGPSAPAPGPAADPASVYYADCAAVRAAGAAPLRPGQPGFRRDLDQDGDGIACGPSAMGQATGDSGGSATPPPVNPPSDPPQNGEIPAHKLG